MNNNYKYKSGDIVLITDEIKNYNKNILNHIFIIHDTVISSPIHFPNSIKIKTGELCNIANNDGGYNYPRQGLRLATKDDIINYLEFLFSNEKVIFKLENDTERKKFITLSEKLHIKLKNNKYFNNKLHYYNSLAGWIDINGVSFNEDHQRRIGCFIISFKYIEYIIRKLNGL